MRVSVKLYGALRRHRPPDAAGAPHHPIELQLPAGSTVADLNGRLAIGDGMVNAAAVNGAAVEPDAPLQEGDVVSLFPPAAGG
jgi:molybdopterin converting factor small subunit